MSKDKDKDKDNGKLISFPGGKRSDLHIDDKKDVDALEIVSNNYKSEDFIKREEFVNKQELVTVSNGASDTASLINVIVKEISEEISHVKYERDKSARDGNNTSDLSVKRTAMLRSLAETILKRKELIISEKFDLKSPRFQAIFNLWMQFVWDAMVKSGISDKDIDVVFQQMKTDMTEWEKKIMDI